jgi:hypothetical protein
VNSVDGDLRGRLASDHCEKHQSLVVSTTLVGIRLFAFRRPNTEFLFPRGDAASLLFGFNAKNQITGVSLLSMAG